MCILTMYIIMYLSKKGVGGSFDSLIRDIVNTLYFLYFSILQDANIRFVSFHDTHSYYRDSYESSSTHMNEYTNNEYFILSILTFFFIRKLIR